MTARDRLEVAQVRLRQEREIVPADDASELHREIELFDHAAFLASVEIESCRARWRQWDAIREGKPLDPVAWIAAPVLAIIGFSWLGTPTNAIIGWLIAGLLSVEAWCWVRTHLRAKGLESACWPRPEELPRDDVAPHAQ